MHRNTRNIKIATNDHVACRISNRTSQQALDVDFITSAGCADVSGQLTNCVLDVRTIQPEQPTKQLSMTSLSKFVQESVIVNRFLETECVGSLEFAKSSVFAQLSHVVTRDSKRVALRCPAQRTTKELLRLVGHHTPTHCHVFRAFLQQILCQFTRTNRQHVVHMHSNATVQFRVHKQTRIALILNETMFFQLARQMFLSASRR